MQGHKNGHEAAGLRRIEAVRASSVGRARLTLSVGVGRDWAFTKESVENANSRGYTGFLGRLSGLVGKVHTIDDNAGYHTSKMSAGHIKDNAGRLRRTSTLPHTPNDNAAEPQIRAIKAAMSNVGLDSVGAISSGLKWCFENGLINPVKPYDYAMVDSPRISPRKASAIKKRLESGEHFVYVRRVAPDKEIRLPTVDELRARDERILPPEKRAMLPPILANSNIPANFLARLPFILLA